MANLVKAERCSKKIRGAELVMSLSEVIKVAFGIKSAWSMGVVTLFRQVVMEGRRAIATWDDRAATRRKSITGNHSLCGKLSKQFWLAAFHFDAVSAGMEGRGVLRSRSGTTVRVKNCFVIVE